MLDASQSSDPFQKNAGYYVGLAIVVLGYAIALIGCPLLKNLPSGNSGFHRMWLLGGLMVQSGILCAMILPARLDRRLGFAPPIRVFSATMVLCPLMVTLAMVLFANMKWTSWSNYLIFDLLTWIVLTAAFHCAAIVHQSRGRKRMIETPVCDFDADQRTNPYAPPMQSQPRTNNAIH